MANSLTTKLFTKAWDRTMKLSVRTKRSAADESATDAAQPIVGDQFDGRMTVAIIQGHGWAGADRIRSGVLEAGPVAYPDLVVDVLSLDLYDTQHSSLDAVIVPGAIHLLVVRATFDGASIARKFARNFPDHEMLVVAAVADGRVGPSVPHSVRKVLRGFRSIAPVAIIPYVDRWRWDPHGPSSSKYHKSMVQLIGQLVELETLRLDQVRRLAEQTEDRELPPIPLAATSDAVRPVKSSTEFVESGINDPAAIDLRVPGQALIVENRPSANAYELPTEKSKRISLRRKKQSI